MNVRGPFLGMLLGVVALIAATGVKPQLRIAYNASDSAPRGWYLVVHPDHFRVGDYVVARLPEDAAALAATRGYLPRSVPVLKRIAAARGQHVCIRNDVVYIDGAAVTRILDADPSRRPLTAWLHCRLLVGDELFLLNGDVPASFDSRYFGPIDVSFVRGRAIPWSTEQRQ
jgi:conjugative transfer signal peptidase TraF